MRRRCCGMRDDRRIVKFAFRHGLLLAAGLLGVVCTLAQEQTKPSLSPAEREAHWREDLQFLVAGLSAPGNTFDLQRGISTRGQKDFEKLYPKALFDAEIKALGSDISKL